MELGLLPETLERTADRLCEGEEKSRRDMVLAALSLGLMGLAATARTQSGPVNPKDYWVSPTARLVRRITYGLLPEDVASANSLTYSGFRDRHINFNSINDLTVQSYVEDRWPRLTMSAAQLGNISDDWVTIQHHGEATIYRAVNGKRQLLEKMVEFWTDHFNVHVDKTGGWLTVPFERDVIRPNALGTFPNLLKAVANSAAMMVYLDNTENYGDFGNINYARELLELHTMSVSGGYTGADIRNVQRCFSGWSMYWDPNSSNHGKFWYWDWAHSTLPKTVLGVTIPPGQKSEGDFVLDLLANHPKTAEFISRKLCKFFLEYNPSQALVDVVKAEYLATGGNIGAMLKKVLTSANVIASPAKYKRPYQMMMGAMRNMKTVFNGDQWSLRYEHLYNAGQLPYNWLPPDGYPDKMDFWAGLILPRWNFALMLPQSYVWNTSVDIPALLGTANTATAITNKINDLLFNGEMMPGDKQDVLDFLSAQPVDAYRTKAAFAIALASPSFQWY
jgi:hypothetical protein